MAAAAIGAVSCAGCRGLLVEPPGVRELRRGRAEADDRGDVLDAAAPGALLHAADDEGRDAQAAAHEERGGALRATELVRRHRAEVGAEGGEVDGHVTGGRARVDVHEHPAARDAPRDVDPRATSWTRADLVVRELHAHQRGVGSSAASTSSASTRPSRSTPTIVTLGGVAAARLEHGRVLDRGRHDVSAIRRAARAASDARPRPRC